MKKSLICTIAILSCVYIRSDIIQDSGVADSFAGAAFSNDIQGMKSIIHKENWTKENRIINSHAKLGNETALHQASYWANRAAIKFLLKKGADVNALDKDGKTALIRLVEQGSCPFKIEHVKKYISVIKLLKKWGANINAQSFLNAKKEPGWTSLHFAEYFKNREIAEFLRSEGARSDIPNGAGQTADDFRKAK